MHIILPLKYCSKQYSLFLFWKPNADFLELSLVATASDCFYSTS